MYLSKEYILAAIRNLRDIHPFYGITFLACKKNGLSIGAAKSFPMDRKTAEFMNAVHKLNPESNHFFQPYRSNMRDKYWVTKKYPSSGLQAINTQTFIDAFIHEDPKTWGWKSDYVNNLKKMLGDGVLSLFDFAVWILRYHKWAEEATHETVMKTFANMFHITDEEHEMLFTTDINGYPITNPFQSDVVIWEDLCSSFEPAPDAGPSRGATLSYLELKNVGPAGSIIMEPNNRLNIITGDNGLGKSFVMECSWWALTGEWCEEVARPINLASKPAISYALANKKGVPMKEIVKYDEKKGAWPKSKNAPSIPGLIVYARVDGSYAVWDPAQHYDANASKKHVFTREEVWNGSDAIEGLLRDWVTWQRVSNSDGSSFEVLKKVLKEMSPPDMGELMPGTPIRTLNDKREIPTIVHPYGEVPITNASAGVRRIITLAYLIVWAWSEHNIAAELRKVTAEKRIVILIDEVEAHLHPKWQRTILPALLNIQSLLSGELEIQFIISTHSPLIMASSETYFNEETDQLFSITVNKTTGEAELTAVDFIKYGQINEWLTSPIFNLGQARSREAENAIEQAKRLQLEATPNRQEVYTIHKRLLKELSESDSFWHRWLYFAEKQGVIL